MPSLHWATGTQTNVDTVPSYAPRNPSELANVTRDRAYSNAAPSEFTMALSALRAAAEAQLLFARLMTRSAICFSSCIILNEFSLFRAADRDLANLDRRKTHADGNRLSILAADSDAVVQLEIISHCCYLSQHGRPVADQCCTLDWSCDPATLNEICLAGRKNEFAAGDVDLAAAKVDGVKTFFHGLDNVFRGRFPGHHECVRHAWHRNVVITLPA